MFSGANALSAVRGYWQVGGEGRQRPSSDFGFDRYVGATWGKFGWGKENITGRHDKAGGNMVYSRNWRRLVWLEQRICMCWRAGHGTECSRRSKQALNQSSCCRGSDVGLKFWDQKSQMWLEMHFEKHPCLLYGNLAERDEKGWGEAGIWGPLQKAGGRWLLGPQGWWLGWQEVDWSDRAETDGTLPEPFSGVLRERQVVGIEIEAQRVKDHVTSKQK